MVIAHAIPVIPMAGSPNFPNNRAYPGKMVTITLSMLKHRVTRGFDTATKNCELLASNMNGGTPQAKVRK